MSNYNLARRIFWRGNVNRQPHKRWVAQTSKVPQDEIPPYDSTIAPEICGLTVLCHWEFGTQQPTEPRRDDLRMTNLFHSSTRVAIYPLLVSFRFTPHPPRPFPSPRRSAVPPPQPKCRCGSNSRWRRNADFVLVCVISRNISIAMNAHTLKSVLIAARPVRSISSEGSSPFQWVEIDMCFVVIR
jgi:hypothetical protein